MYSTHKIVGISTLSRAVHGTAQTREYAGTKVVISQVIAIIVLCVLVSTNCICTIGTKNVGKEMKKISKGRVRDRDKTWFSQLADKRELIRYGVLLLELFIIHVAKSIKLHLYWSMKNCGRNPTLLRDLIDNIVNHYVVSTLIVIVHCHCFHDQRVITVDVAPILYATQRHTHLARSPSRTLDVP